ncbi:MAG: permease [Candidatus Fervidibacter sp.]|uniref:permease n=1 Tax=Candidatus Fervidibacter sp. TaxID=3100871 RepID=UPI004049D065
MAGLKKAWKSFEGILPQFAGIIVLISLLLTFLSPATISKLIGSQTGFLGMLITSLVGAITLIPRFIAFSLAASLKSLGAGTGQVAVFVSSLMMVGVVTAPLEARYFGKKVTLTRNVLAYVASFIVGFVVGVVAR